MIYVTSPVEESRGYQKILLKGEIKGEIKAEIKNLKKLVQEKFLQPEVAEPKIEELQKQLAALEAKGPKKNSIH